MIIAKIKFMNTPPMRMMIRAGTLAAPKLPGAVRSRSVDAFSPFRRTNPPNGIQLSEKRVPPLVKSVLARGGSPKPNSSTVTPALRAAKKCPHSWMNTRKLSRTKNARMEKMRNTGA